MATLQVLIVDDDPDFARSLKVRCEQMEINAEISCDALHAVTAIERNPPDVIVLDLNMPGQDGLSTYEKLTGDGEWSPESLVILTGQSDDQTMQRCRQLGVHYLLKGYDTWEKLKLILETAQNDKVATDKAASKKHKVLSIDDDPAIGYALRVRLEPYGVEVLHATDGMKGYWMALQEQPDVIITDYSMPEGQGNYVVSRLSGHSLTRNIPVIVLTGRGQDYSIQRSMFNLGAVAFLTKPLDFAQLLKEIGKYICLSSGPSKARGGDGAASPAPVGEKVRRPQPVA